MTKIMVIDDVSEDREMMEIMLQKKGYKTVLAKDGPEVFSMIDDFNPDLVTLNVMMHGLNVKEILQKLKNILDRNLESLIPDFRSHLNWAIYPTVWHLDGVAKTIDNIKPDIKTPVENLYIIGDCVKAPGIGINCAVNSARILTDILTTPMTK